MNENTNLTQAAKASSNEDDLIIPPVDVVEDDGGITLYADLPGVTKEKLSLQVEAGKLTIEGGLDIAFPEGMEASHAEISLPGFRRIFTLSKELDTEKISAEFKQGLLRLRIPKAEHAQPRKIAIDVE